MLKILNLYVIEQIFEGAETKLGATSRMLYINCLIHHFKDKTATVSNAVAFELFQEDFKDYSKYKRQMQELHKAGLVHIGINSISFPNLWGKHIDRSQLEKVSPTEYVAGFKFEGADAFVDDMIKSQNLKELVKMKHGINEKELANLVSLFVKTQNTCEKKYSSYSDCIRHFTSWLPKNLIGVSKTVVKSNSKILGL